MFRFLLTSSFLTVVFQVAAQTGSLPATTHDPSGFVPEGYELVWIMNWCGTMNLTMVRR